MSEPFERPPAGLYRAPISGPVDLPGTKGWVEPVLVAEVEYREWTPYGRLRAPVFKGLRQPR